MTVSLNFFAKVARKFDRVDPLAFIAMRDESRDDGTHGKSAQTNVFQFFPTLCFWCIVMSDGNTCRRPIFMQIYCCSGTFPKNRYIWLCEMPLPFSLVTGTPPKRVQLHKARVSASLSRCANFIRRKSGEIFYFFYGSQNTTRERTKRFRVPTRQPSVALNVYTAEIRTRTVHRFDTITRTT